MLLCSCNISNDYTENTELTEDTASEVSGENERCFTLEEFDWVVPGETTLKEIASYVYGDDGTLAIMVRASGGYLVELPTIDGENVYIIAYQEDGTSTTDDVLSKAIVYSIEK